MERIWLAAGAVSGFVGVAAGAFGAHALKARLSVEAITIYETAVRYQFWHALALLAVGILAQRRPARGFGVAGWGFAIGTLLFSGSLYALAISGIGKFGAVTPFGGLAFLIGWAALATTTWAGRSARD
jgi:uncharacterized membrane protein YgdD (TMEM256/DUF423 family)